MCCRQLANAVKISVLKACGHVICHTCIDKIIKKDNSCYVCSKKVLEDDIISLQAGGKTLITCGSFGKTNVSNQSFICYLKGTGFAGHGEKLEATIVTPAFI